jgi:hypothetical protein
LERRLTGQDFILREQAERAMGTAEQFPVDAWSKAKTSMDVAVFVL